MENNEQPVKKKMGRKRIIRTGNETSNITPANNDEYLNDIGDDATIAPADTNNIVPPVTENPPPVTETPPADTAPPATDDVSAKPFTDPLLAENVDTKAYGKDMAQNIPTGDIPQAKFTPPKNIVDETATPKQTQQIPQGEKIQPLNAEVNVMTDAEKKAGAELTVGAFWSGYAKVNQFLGALLQYPIEERIAMHNDDTLDLNMKVRISVDGTMVTVNEFYEQYNRDVKELFVVDPEMKARLTEPMKREAMKRGLIMSDIQVILTGFGEDILTKAVQVFSIKRAMNKFTRDMQEQYAKIKKDKKETVEQQKKESNLIDPETSDGQARMYEFYKMIKQMEANDVEKAKATSDLFHKNEVKEEVTETTTVVKHNGSDIEEAVVMVEEDAGNLNSNNEL